MLKSTKLNEFHTLADIVAQTGATVDGFFSFFYKDESHEKTILDIGILRFPDPSHPYFHVRLHISSYATNSSNMNDGHQVYRVKLSAWSQSKRTLMFQEDSNGIAGGKSPFS